MIVLGLMTLVAVALVVYFGRKLALHAWTESPDSDLNLGVTMTGTVLYAVLIGFFIICLASRSLSPESSFGSFMNQPIGLASSILASIFVTVIVGVILGKFGLPVFKGD